MKYRIEPFPGSPFWFVVSTRWTTRNGVPLRIASFRTKEEAQTWIDLNELSPGHDRNMSQIC